VATSHKHARPHGRAHAHAQARAHAHGHGHAHAAATRRRRLVRLVLPAAGLLTVVGISLGVVANSTSSPIVAQASAGDRGDLITAALSNGQVSRSAERAPLPNEAEAEKMIAGHRFVIETDAVDVHADADDTSPVLAILAPGEKVDVTGKKQNGYTEIVHKSLPRWVKTSGLTDDRPLGTSPCPESSGGSGVESGLQPDTIRVHRAVCAKFPSIARWGGRSGGGEHATGRAIDIMVGNGNDIGNEIAAFAKAHAKELGVSQVIWRQHIWTVQRASNGWRAMSNRGSPTANHMDHVHVTTYGNSGTS
jgi:hypothetical protein